MTWNFLRTLIGPAIVVLVLFGGGWYLGHYTTDKKRIAEIAELRMTQMQSHLDAAGRVVDETKKTLEAERRQSEIKSQLEKDNAKAQNRINRLLADNRELVRRAGGLRDPGASAACDAAVSTDTAATNRDSGTAGGRQLSEEASEFLLDLVADADRIVEQCRADRRWAAGLQNANSRFGSDRRSKADDGQQNF